MGLSVSINSLYYPNSNMEFVNAQKKVMEHFNIPVNYYEQSTRHGVWMDTVMDHTNADVVGFIDIDCIPLTKTAVSDLVKFVAKNKSIAGIVQASNHIPPFTHTFVAPSCFFIWRKLYEALRTTFCETHRSDVCEEVCYAAEMNGVRMKALYPTHFEKEPQEGVWRLNNYGLYGVGSVFAGQFYHLYQSRYEENVQLFIKRCDDVVKGKFSTKGMHESTNFNFEGKICRFDAEARINDEIKGKL